METLEKKLGYTFQDRSLLENALTHSSYANERHWDKKRCTAFLFTASEAF